MESDAKQRSHQRNKRRERAARMQKQKAEGLSAADQGSGEEGDESPARQKQRPPARKKRIKVGKEPVFEEDVIDGFAILSFRTYEELENTMKSLEKRSSPVEFVMEAKMEKISPFTNHKQRHKPTSNLLNNNNNTANNNNNNEEEEQAEEAGEEEAGGGGADSDSETCKPIIIQESNGPLLHNNSNSARYRLSDVSSHSSSGRGYMCDSESNDDRGSDTDLFRAATIKRESNSTPTNGRSSPLLLPSLAPIQNGPVEPPVSTTTTTVTTTSVLASKTPSPPIFSPPPPPFVAEVATKSTPSPQPPSHHHHHHHHHHGHPPLQPQHQQVPLPPPPQPAPPQFHFGTGSNGPTLFSPISPRPRPSVSPPLLLSTSPSVPPKASSVCSTTSVITQARPSPGVGASPSTTPSRDSHSSSSSISSLSQLSQSLHLPRDASRSSSRNNTPSCCGVPTSLVFSKPSWAGSISNGPHLTPPPARPTPPPPGSSLGLPLHNHFGPTPAPPPPAPTLHPSAPHPGIFPPPPIALSSLSNPGPAAPFSDPIFSQPHQQDLLRRELDTRFLASQDRTISIPPPPYMRTEMHAHMHQHSPFLGLSVSQPNPHMYDKFPKLEPSSFYNRNTLGLPTYPGLSPLLGAAGTAPGPAPPTPFAPAGQLAAFQPKKHPNLVPRSRLDPVLSENMSPLVKSKNVKSGRWCAMHVRIAWEIYHHQQKQQQQVDVHKAAPPGKSPSDLLRPPGNLFSALPRPHDLPPLSGSLLAASVVSSRGFEAQAQHHNSFLNPSPAHLGSSPSSMERERRLMGRLPPSAGVSHFARPAYPGFAGPATSFAAGLSTLGLAGPGLFGNRDLGAAATCLTGLGSAQDPLYRLHRAPPTFPTAAVAPPPPPTASWGGLKAEADRERMHREQQEQEQKRREKEQMERREKEQQLDRFALPFSQRNATQASTLSLSRERREQERQKERDRENRVFHHHHHHHQHVPESLRNGEASTQEPPQRTSQQSLPRDWGDHRRAERRSPLRKNESAFESGKQPPEVKVKEEKKDEAEADRTNDFLARTLGTRLPPTHGFWGNPADPFRGMEFHQVARDQILHRYGPLVPVGPHERFREAELAARHDPFAFDRSKLPPPPLRPNDPYPGTGLGPPGAIFPPLLSGLGSARGKGASPSTAIPPPLIPCTNHQGPPHKLDPHESYFVRERQELGLHPVDLDAQSR